MSEVPLIQAGEYNFDYVEILLADGDAIDISNQIDALIVYEDIHSPILSGKLTLRDTLQIPNFALLTGRDLLSFQVNTKPLQEGGEAQLSRPLTGLFHIYKHADTALVGDRMQTYTLYFQSMIGMVNTNLLTHRAYGGNPSGIITSIFEEHFPVDDYNVSFMPVNTDYAPTNRVNFVSNMWSPIKSMTYAAKAAKGSDNDLYLFHESRYGFRLSQLNEIKTRAPVENFYDNDYTINMVTDGMSIGTARRTPIADYRKAIETRVDVMFDYLRDTQSGAIKTELTTYDILNKRVVKSEYSYEYDAAKSLNPKPLWLPTIIEKTNPTQLYSTRNYKNASDVDSLSLDDVSYIRDAKMRTLNSSKIEIDIFGRLNYKLGDIVTYHTNMKAPIKQVDDINAGKDLLLSGDYIITAINHRFDRAKYMMTLELSKNDRGL